MAITEYSQTRVGNVTTVSVVSDLTGTIYYHWYLDGAWQGQSLQPSWNFSLEDGDQARVECIDTNDADFDPIANAPEGFPSRIALTWSKPGEEFDTAYFEVRMYDEGQTDHDNEDGELIGTIRADEKWMYTCNTPPIPGIQRKSFRVTPFDRVGNAGTPIDVAQTKYVAPDSAPEFDLAFDEGTSRVTFSEAS